MFPGKVGHRKRVPRGTSGPGPGGLRQQTGRQLLQGDFKDDFYVDVAFLPESNVPRYLASSDPLLACFFHLWAFPGLFLDFSFSLSWQIDHNKFTSELKIISNTKEGKSLSVFLDKPHPATREWPDLKIA